MRIIKSFTLSAVTLALGSMTSTLWAMGEHTDTHMSSHQMRDMSDMQYLAKDVVTDSAQINHAEHAEHAVELPIASTEKHVHTTDHRKEHGGQIYQSTEIDNRWLSNSDGEGLLKSELESRIGTDENKLFLKLHADKAESAKADYAAQALYSRMISDFWDVQAGVRYRYDQKHSSDKSRYDAALGLHGLAPYFFETDAYLFVGQDNQVSFSLETERDILLTQKLITQPYLNMNVVFSDDSRYAQKTGLNDVWLGVETRYEISKKIMPFVDIAYHYEKGEKQTAWQTKTDSEADWWYGAGVRMKF